MLAKQTAPQFCSMIYLMGCSFGAIPVSNFAKLQEREVPQNCDGLTESIVATCRKLNHYGV
ncbi:hypothetical protein Brsp01_10060 [Brucella sp. NBRC 12950]|nr:hypothetical protein Brsp01_10060 [Brucella sp. NBRC 12950]